jgi:hypothetical protein
MLACHICISKLFWPVTIKISSTAKPSILVSKDGRFVAGVIERNLLYFDVGSVTSSIHARSKHTVKLVLFIAGKQN